MRIQGPFGSAATASPVVTRRGTSAKFSVNGETDARSATQTSALRTVGGIDALVALQGVEDPTERRKQAVKRGRGALDALDDLKVGLLTGNLGPAALARLKSVAAGLKNASGDAGLDGVLGEIELRVEVEIAKISSR
jgi:hypothetical protein